LESGGCTPHPIFLGVPSILGGVSSFATWPFHNITCGFPLKAVTKTGY